MYMYESKGAGLEGGVLTKIKKHSMQSCTYRAPCTLRLKITIQTKTYKKKPQSNLTKDNEPNTGNRNVTLTRKHKTGRTLERHSSYANTTVHQPTRRRNSLTSVTSLIPLGSLLAVAGSGVEAASVVDLLQDLAGGVELAKMCDERVLVLGGEAAELAWEELLALLVVGVVELDVVLLLHVVLQTHALCEALATLLAAERVHLCNKNIEKRQAC